MLWSYEHPDRVLIMDSRKVQRDFLGGTPSEVSERYIAESPILHVTSETPPTLLVHGKIDALVHYEQSVRLAKELVKYKVKNMLLLLPWATHGCEYNLNAPQVNYQCMPLKGFFYAVTQPGK